jgi:pimeloyl-ACP methyl ester carboxylesterase
MRSVAAIVPGVVLMCVAASPALAAPPVPYEFRAADGTTVAAQLGELTVPEHRGNPHSRQLRLRYVLFPATGKQPGPPIIYLAGGPGGSGIDTARRERFPMFMALREVGDVIALDQRGTGLSNDLPVCDSGVNTPADMPLTRDSLTQAVQQAAQVCERFWAQRGIDLNGYNTLESVADLEDLRRALGAPKLTLWGISYGSHLALAAVKQLSARIERVVIASGEGLDQTIKRPAHSDAFFTRFSSVLRASHPGADIPDVPALLRRVHQRLELEPAKVWVPDVTGSEGASIVIGKYDVQLLAASMIADPPGTVRLIKLYQAMDRGDFTVAAQLIYAVRRSPIRMTGMPEAMDIASGVSDRELAAIFAQAQQGLLSDALNYPMPHLRGALGIRDLGEQFRRPARTRVPILLLTGTLDGRTYLEAQADIVRSLGNCRQIMVENAGHNVYMTSPEITPAVLAFLKGGKSLPRRIAISPPAW